MFIGLLGGTFNPIHNGHLHIAQHIFRILKPDQVLFIPSGDPPHKSSTSLVSAHHRLEMVKLAIQPYPYFRVYDREVVSPGTSYTFDTVTHLKKEFPAQTRFGFIIGLDAFLDIQSWKNAEELLSLCQFIVCSRPGMAFSGLQHLPFFPSAYTRQLENLDSGAATRIDVELVNGPPLLLLAVPPSEVSASTIRDHLSRGKPVGHWLPPLVESYILQHQLYQCPQ